MQRWFVKKLAYNFSTSEWGFGIENGLLIDQGGINMRNRRDITGNRYGRLVVLCANGHTSNGNLKWVCQCDCGKVCTVDGQRLRRGETLSCGCLRKEVSSKALKINSATSHMTSVHGSSKPILPGNAQKLRSTNISGVTGVRYDPKRNRWLARLFLDGRYVLNRSFYHKSDAIEARHEAELKFLSVKS